MLLQCPGRVRYIDDIAHCPAPSRESAPGVHAARTLGGLLALAAIAAGGFVLVEGVPSAAGPGPAAASVGSASTTAIGAAAAVGSRPPSQVTALQASSEGQQLYLQACASCHGTTGAGSNLAPSLANSGTAAFDFFLRTGRMPLSGPGQPAFRQGRRLTQDEIDALVGYGATLGTGPAIPQLTSTASIPDGWQLFINNCAACHGAAASGGSVGPDVFAPSLHGKDAQTIAEAVLVGPGAMPRFEWNDQQLADVAAYVEQLSNPPTPGGQSLGGFGPVPEGLIAGVLGLGLLVLVCRWIGLGARPEEADEVQGVAPTDDQPTNVGAP